MIKKFIYSKIRLFFQKRTKHRFKTIVDKKTYFEGCNKVCNGDFSGSWFGFGSISGSSLPHCKIGKYSSIGRDCHIIPAFHDYSNFSMSPLFFKTKMLVTRNQYYAEIGNDVWIGSNVLIKGGVVVGDGAVVGMGSVVLNDVPPYSIVAGVPARVIKMRFDNGTIEKLTKSSWWTLDYKLLKKASDKREPNNFLEEIQK